jgi:hypothetical protein
MLYYLIISSMSKNSISFCNLHALLRTLRKLTIEQCSGDIRMFSIHILQHWYELWSSKTSACNKFTTSKATVITFHIQNRLMSTSYSITQWKHISSRSWDIWFFVACIVFKRPTLLPVNFGDSFVTTITLFDDKLYSSWAVDSLSCKSSPADVPYTDTMKSNSVIISIWSVHFV